MSILNDVETLALGVSVAPCANWQSMRDLAPLIVVGLTGVGKSTAVRELTSLVPSLALLPNRRELTDALIIARMQVEEGVPVAIEPDRARRFAYTRGYRAQYPGGMAHALAQLWIDPELADGPLLFDGLRGANEVQHATKLLPHASFVALHAPDIVRARRLLNRNDSFDRLASSIAESTDRAASISLHEINIDGLDASLSQAEQKALLAEAADGHVALDDLRAKLRIIVEERRNYDPEETLRALQESAPERTQIFDTTRLSARQIAQAIARQLPLSSAGHS